MRATEFIYKMDSPYSQEDQERKQIISRSQTYQSLLQPDTILAYVHQPSFISFVGPVITKDGVSITQDVYSNKSKLAQINSQFNQHKPDNPIIVLDSNMHIQCPQADMVIDDESVHQCRNRFTFESSISIQNSIMRSLFLENCHKWEKIGYAPKKYQHSTA